MSDAIALLDELIAAEPHGSTRTARLQAVKDELLALRAVAGAVSAGPDHSEIKQALGKRPGNPPHED